MFYLVFLAHSALIFSREEWDEGATVPGSGPIYAAGTFEACEAARRLLCT